jgi:hypothetical protein
MVAAGAVAGAIGLSVALALAASWIGGDAAGIAYLVVWLVGVPAFLLLVPVLIVFASLEYAGNRAYRGKPIAASWDVLLDGEVHVVSLPESRSSSPDHAWVDGAKTRLSWTPTGAMSARAALDGGTLSGTLSKTTDVHQDVANLALFAVSAVLGAATAVEAGARYTLEVEGATVEVIPVADGERRPYVY